jgi:release factor glutamine methyltransferase
MRNIIKYFVGIVYKPLLERYLSKPRHYKYKGVNLVIPPEVFHPAFFFTSKLLLHYVSLLPVMGKTFLELGAGSGMLSIYAAKKNARVTATDINPVAIEFLKKNSLANNVTLQIIYSDLFQNIPHQHFDYIAINPPFYKKDPVSDKDYAWYCGKNGEYFQGLFYSLANYSNSISTILMILSDDCDLEMINYYATEYGFKMDKVYTKQNLLEKNFIFKIQLRETDIEISNPEKHLQNV